MNIIKLLAFGTAQLAVLASPAAAAPLETDQTYSAQQRGAFAGARFRVSFGGKESGKAQATVSLTSVQRSRDTGVSALSEGLQLGVQGKKLAFSVAGAPVAMSEEARAKAGISTLGWVGIGVGVLAAGLYGFAQWAESRSE